jgi:chromosome partitioning protein
MAIVITLAHQKGGVGKSTLSLNLYGYFAHAGQKCVLVDIDPQGSITSLLQVFDEAGKVHLIERTSFKNYTELQEKIQGYDVAIIDTPPYLSKELLDCLAISNMVVIPCKASPFDALAVVQTVELIKAEQVKNPHLLASIVLTMTISGTSLPQQIRQSLEKHGLPVLQTEIGNRIAYARSLLFSGSVIADDTGKARDEISSLAHELVDLITSEHS